MESACKAVSNTRTLSHIKTLHSLKVINVSFSMPTINPVCLVLFQLKAIEMWFSFLKDVSLENVHYQKLSFKFSLL